MHGSAGVMRRAEPIEGGGWTGPCALFMFYNTPDEADVLAAALRKIDR
jgi:hypothetical protein